MFQISEYCHGRWPLRVDLLADEVYLVQQPKNITQIFSHPSLTALQVYLSDTSGFRGKPLPGSQVEETARVSHYTHRNLAEGLLGEGLDPTTRIFEEALFASLAGVAEGSAFQPQEWVQDEDLTQFLEEHLGSSIVKALFGPLLLATSADLIQDLWDYDRRLATILSASNTEETTDNLVWGSAMMRRRHEMLLKLDKQDSRAVASADLALIWASVTNVVPSTVISCLHIYQDISLLKDIRQCARVSTVQKDPLKLDIKLLEKNPLLLSIYAETLRFGVQIHIPRCSPHHDLQVGDSIIPMNKLVLINTWLSHMDDSVWNTRSGQYPLNGFWPRPWTGKPGNRKGYVLEGIWIPYGGGQHACPGRILARRIMLLTVAMITTFFDIELLAPSSALEFVSPRFGFGVKKPAGRVPFRIRRRL
ncbi:cytochrome P450 [Aspergillus stella-maris]|uniref:cytochrome P450 n=1 Tax=Aspergillus stella-maris TaxID=1810926 RepID=UPI003CCE4135